MRIVFMGTPEFAISPLEQLIGNGHELAAVCTRPDKPAGRGREPLPPPMKVAAQKLNISVLQILDWKSAAALDQLTACHPDVIVVAAYGQLLPQAVLNLAPLGCLNIHPSLLPRYRGPAPVPAAILAGDPFAGVSIMRLDAGMDSGPVFSRAQIGILLFDTSESLLTKLFQTGGQLLCQVLAELPSGKLSPWLQNEAEATYTREIIPADGKIDWSLPAREIWRRVRAYQPWPGAYTNWQGKQLKILKAATEPFSEPQQAGRVIALPGPGADSGAGFGVTTGQDILAVYEVQIEGKRAMPAHDFLRGQRDFLGSVLS